MATANSTVAGNATTLHLVEADLGTCDEMRTIPITFPLARKLDDVGGALGLGHLTPPFIGSQYKGNAVKSQPPFWVVQKFSSECLNP